MISESQAFTLVESEAMCGGSGVYLNGKLGHDFASKEDCAHIMPSVKGKHGCSNSSGFFTSGGLEVYGSELCFCAEDDCDSAKRHRNDFSHKLYSIYRMLGKCICL